MFCNFYQAEREPIEDKRVDVCLYMLPPTGHGIKKIDLESLKRIQAWEKSFLHAQEFSFLQDFVTVIPCVAKADSFTKEELVELKQQVCEYIVKP